MKRTLSLAALTLGFLLVLAPVAHAVHWTAVASTGAIDETPLGGVHAFGSNPTSFGYNPAFTSTLPIVARYNVTDTSGTGRPLWTTLELGYLENSSGSAVSAQLFQVDPCSGQRTLICGVTSINSAAPSCVQCTFSTQIDFGQYLYYVEVTVSRNSSSLFPTANTLRIF